jgi:hypothetical protein
MYGSGMGGESALSSWSMLKKTLLETTKARTQLRIPTHHCSFMADPCRLNPPPDPIIPTTPDTVALAAVATIPATAPTSKLELEAAGLSPGCEDTPTPNIWEPTPSKAGFSVTSRLRAVMRDVKTLEPDSSASYRAQTLRMSSASVHSLFAEHEQRESKID